MKAFFLLLYLMIFLPWSSLGQYLFHATFGGSDSDILRSIEKVDDSTYLLAGDSESFGDPNNRDYFISTLSTSGTLSGSLTFATDDRDILYKAFKFSEDYFLTGLTTKNNNSSTRDDWVITRRNADGSDVWTSVWGSSNKDDQLSDAIMDENDNIVACGSADIELITSGLKGAIIKYNQFGTREWARFYRGGGSNTKFRKIKEVADGYIVSGTTTYLDNGNSNDVLLAKTTKDGSDLLWAKAYDKDYPSLGTTHIEVLENGDMIIADNVAQSDTDEDILLIRTNSTGQVSWANKYGGAQKETCRFLHLTEDETLVVGGSSTSFGNGGEDGLVFQVDLSTGEIIWSHAYGQGDNDAFYDLESYGEDDFIAVGRTRSFNAGGSTSDAYIVVLDGTGQEVDSCGETNDVSMIKEPINVADENMPHVPMSWVNWDNEITSPVFIANDQNISMDSMCTFVPVFEPFSEVAIDVFPNPASNQINFSINNYGENNLELLVTNYFGQIVHQENINWQTSLSVFDWPKGVYIYHLKTEKGASVATGKFIVN